ncbi:hypothetical protein HYY73_01480 [Candidatus Woesearchaeota archaeon]|nr:hypothetical protein [Candidatus Woesearchaeota archaeon]
MILYLLPILDIVTAAVLMLHVHFNIFPFVVVLVHGIYLSFKGAVFARSDFASKIDLLCGIYIMLVAFGLFANSTIALIILIWLMQKAVLALLPLR